MFISSSSSGSVGRRPVGVQRLHQIHGPRPVWSPMLALDFIRIFSLRTEYLHPSVRPSHFSLKESSRLRTGSDIHYLVVSEAAMPPTFASFSGFLLSLSTSRSALGGTSAKTFTTDGIASAGTPLLTVATPSPR